MSTNDFEYVIDPPDHNWNYEPSKIELYKTLTAALYTTDADGWLTYYNDAAAALWGYRPPRREPLVWLLAAL